MLYSRYHYYYHYRYGLQIILEHLLCADYSAGYSFLPNSLLSQMHDETHKAKGSYRLIGPIIFMMNDLSLLHSRNITEHYNWSLGTRIACEDRCF